MELRVVDPASEAAARAMAAYFAELDDTFVGGFTSDDTDDDLAAMRAPTGAFVVVVRGDETVGCGGVRRLEDGTAEIKRMWIDRSLRGQGVGRQLLIGLEDQARRLGHEVVVLDTNSTLDTAIAMYERAGYESIERYNDNPYAHLFFRKQL